MNIKAKVGIIITKEDGSILLIKEKYEKNKRFLWNIIKGTYEGGESIFDTVKRECKEEIGLDVELQNSLGTYISEGENKIRVQFNFLVHSNTNKFCIASKIEQSLLNENIESAKWMTKKEVLKIDKDQFLSNRAFQLVQDWSKEHFFELDTYKHVKM